MKSSIPHFIAIVSMDILVNRAKTILATLIHVKTTEYAISMTMERTAIVLMDSVVIDVK